MIRLPALAGALLGAAASIAYAQPPAGTGTWVQVWGDDFATSNLDTTKWWTRQWQPGGPIQSESSNGDQQLWAEGQNGCPNHVMLDPGINLQICGPAAPATNPTAGYIQSKTYWPIETGPGYYFEYRVKFSGVSGTHSAVWLTGQPRAGGSTIWPPELGFPEVPTSGQAGQSTANLHMDMQTNGVPWANPGNTTWTGYAPFNASYSNCYDACVTFNGDGSYFTEAAPFSNADYHTYGLLYVPGAAGQPHQWTTYVDGQWQLTGTYEFIGADGNPVPGATIIIDTEVGDNFVGNVLPTTYPAALDVLWVHVYELQQPPSTFGTNYMPNGG